MSTRRGRIITFYSYKGGTGRSMLLANVAWILASNGKRVLAIDWDLEAPGLHRYFCPFLPDPDLVGSDGIIDLVIDFATAAMSPQPLEAGETPPVGESSESVPPRPPTRADGEWFKPYADIFRYACTLQFPFPHGGTLDFLPAGRQTATYATRVNSFNWQAFYDRIGGGVFLESLRQQMRGEYDYILIDSRTGVSDTAGICTVQLPDILVACFTLNNQSIAGAAAVAESVKQQRDAGEHPVTIFPVTMRVDLFEQDRLNRARKKARGRFDGLMGRLTPDQRQKYWGETEVLYFPYYSYEEVLATFADPAGQPNSLLGAIERVASHLTGEDLEMASPDDALREDVLRRFAGVGRALTGQIISEEPKRRWWRGGLAARRVPFSPSMWRAAGVTAVVASVVICTAAAFVWKVRTQAERNIADSLARQLAESNAALRHVSEDSTAQVKRINAALNEAESKAQAARRENELLSRKLGDSETARQYANAAVIEANSQSAKRLADLQSSEKARAAERDNARSRELAAEALLLVERDHDLATLLAIEAANAAPTPRAVDALRECLTRMVPKTILQGHTDLVDQLVFIKADTGYHLLSASYDGTVRVWHIRGAATSDMFRHDGGSVNDAACDRSGSLMAVGGADGKVDIWDLKTRRIIQHLEDTGAVLRVGFSADGSRVLTATRNAVSVWHTRTHQPPIKRYSAEDDKGHALGNRELAPLGASFDGLLLAGSPPPNPQQPPTVATFSDDGRFVATGGENALRVFEAASGITLLSDKRSVQLATFSADGSVLASSAWLDETLTLWRLPESKQFRTLAVPSGLTTIGLSGDGTLLVMIDFARGARIWRASDQRTIPLFLPDASPEYAAFSNDSKLVVTCGPDRAQQGAGLAQIWEVATGRPRSQPFRNKTVLNRACFSPDGELLATAGRDGTIQVWNAAQMVPDVPKNIPADELIRLAREQVGSRELTDEEKRLYIPPALSATTSRPSGVDDGSAR